MAFARRSQRGSYQSNRQVAWLIVGLGNPGAKYEGTRHNAGALVVQRIAADAGVQLSGKYDGLFGYSKIGDEDVALLVPLTYMNLSGRSVRPAMKACGIKPDRVLIVHDEADIPMGDVRQKFGGGLAGHNGLKSVTQELGTRDYARLRLGVGRPPEGDPRPLDAWVLTKFSDPAEADQLVSDGVREVERIVANGIEA
jgi:PTH1 family peptidyl-tRNA hydrolase